MMYMGIAVKLLFGLIALIVMTRLLGKKEMSQLTPFDFVYAVVLAGILEESIYDDKVNLLHLLFALAIWGSTLYLIEKLSKKYDKVRLLFKGNSSILVQEGKLNLDELNKNHLEMEQLRLMLRQQGVFSLSEVKDVYLDPGGSISVKKFAKYDQVTPEMLNLDPEDDPVNYLVIDEGEMNEEIMKQVRMSKEWLHERLQKEGYSSVSDILYGEWSEKNGLYVHTYADASAGKSEGN